MSSPGRSPLTRPCCWCQGCLPDSLNKVEDPALKEFINVCLDRDKDRRPSAAKLLKHPFLQELQDDEDEAHAPSGETAAASKALAALANGGPLPPDAPVANPVASQLQHSSTSSFDSDLMGQMDDVPVGHKPAMVDEPESGEDSIGRQAGRGIRGHMKKVSVSELAGSYLGQSPPLDASPPRRSRGSSSVHRRGSSFGLAAPIGNDVIEIISTPGSGSTFQVRGQLPSPPFLPPESWSPPCIFGTGSPCLICCVVLPAPLVLLLVRSGGGSTTSFSGRIRIQQCTTVLQDTLLFGTRGILVR